MAGLQGRGTQISPQRSSGIDRQALRGEDPVVVLRQLIFWNVLILAESFGALAAEPVLTPHESKYYIIHTDLPEIEAREAVVRMTHMVDEYLQHTSKFSGKLKERLPFYLYKNLLDYTKAVGVAGSGGYFDGQKLMATTLRSEDGAISRDTWHIVQHEGFHQFAHAVIGGEFPMWADEGLAEYFGEAIFTGDGFETGLIPQLRLVRVRALLVDGNARPFVQFLALSREQWNAKVDLKNYDQAWSIVHFLMHGENGKLQKTFENVLHDVAKGESAERAYRAHFDEIPDLERRYRKWWLGLPDEPTSTGYARATLATLTSFLARAHLHGQDFSDFDAMQKTPAVQFKQPEEQWLPPALLAGALVDATRRLREGDKFELVKPGDGTPSIVLMEKHGGKWIGKFTAGKDGRIELVRVEESK